MHVVYGLVGYKIHAKMCLVVRRDEDGIRRYVHLSTGNYNPNTASIYTDIGLFTCRPDVRRGRHESVQSADRHLPVPGNPKFLVAPFELHGRILELIQRETENAKKGLPARIIAKMNALVDPKVIEALYRASQAGVKIDLIVRGICCLRPGSKGISENITVRSIVDRFLEHSRIFYFENACQPEIFVGSADWMPRNLFRRIEVVFPIEDGNLREQIRSDLLDIVLEDNSKARFLQADGSYTRPKPKRGAPVRRSQTDSMKVAIDILLGGSTASQDQRPLSASQACPPPFSEEIIIMFESVFIPSKDEKSRRLMLILHGLGDSVEGFRWLPEALQLPELNYLLINAPDPYYGGFSWFDFSGNPTPGINRSRELLFKLLEELPRKGFKSSQTLLFGFSQGSLMAIETATHYPALFAGVIGVSGYIHEPERLARELPPMALQQRFLITHGTMDPLVPFLLARPQVKMLQKAGFKIEWHELMKAHTVAGEGELKIIRDFINRSF